MKRIAVIADSHFDEHSRMEECVRLHDWITNDLRERGVDLVVHTGDVFERKSTPTERLAVASWLRALGELAPVVVVRGNHDVLGDLAIYRSLRTKHPILVEEAAAVHVIGGVAVAAVAWPRKAHLLANVAGGLEESEQLAGDAMRNVLRGLGDQLATHDGPRILAMHAMVRGSVTSVGQPLVGCDLELGLDDLAIASAQLVALGHIHAGQDWTFGSTPIVYPGSPRRTSFGEVEDKGYLIIEIDGADVRWERVIVPATPMFLLEDEWGGAESAWLVGWHGMPERSALRGAEVRARYAVAADQREAARRAVDIVRADLLAAGVTVVKVEERVSASTRARAPEIAQAKTLDDKLAALWRMRGLDLEPTRVAELLTKTHQLEEEAAA